MGNFFTPLPRALAHRGDCRNYPENTEPAFRSALELGADVIETDIHLTADGKVLIWHDDNFSRVAKDSRKIWEISSEEIEGIDAGRCFSSDGGKTFPFRNRGIRPLFLQEVLQIFPEARFNIDLKDNNPDLAESCASVIRREKAAQRVCIASFHHQVLKVFRRLAPEVATSLSRRELCHLILTYRLGITIKSIRKEGVRVIQIPEYHHGLKILTKSLIRWAEKKSLFLQVWTVNDPAEMNRLFQAGVHGIFSDDAEAVIKAASHSILAPPRQISPS